MILFDQHKHLYYDTKGAFISATTLIKSYSQGFDADAQAQKKEEQTGVSAEVWKKRWKDYGEERAGYGTEFHERKEEQESGMVKFGGKWVPTNNQWFLLQQLNQWNYAQQLPDGHYTELRLWHGGYRVAGTADKILLETVNGKRFMHIEDHKTNLKLPKESFQYTYGPKAGQYKRMLPPVSHIMDCAFWHYNLQLSLYQFMGEFMGFKVGERRILHYGVSDFELLQGQKPSVDELLRREPTVHPVKYLKKEVLSICEHYLKSLTRPLKTR